MSWRSEKRMKVAVDRDPRQDENVLAVEHAYSGFLCNQNGQ